MKKIYKLHPEIIASLWFVMSLIICLCISICFDLNENISTLIAFLIFIGGLWYFSSEYEIHILPSRRKKYHRNKELIKTCYTLVKSYEEPGFLSSWSYIYPNINSYFYNNDQLITEEDSLVISHKLLLEISSSILSNGEFHLTEGTLSTFGPTRNLEEVYNHSILWLKERNIINETEVEALRQELIDNINCI